MPKNKFQEFIFTIMMVIVMVYAMICYNISLAIGGLKNIVFINALHELIIIVPIAFIIDFFIVSKLSFLISNKIVDIKKDHPFHMILAISASSVAMMCPIMSLIATLLFKNAGSEFIAVWLQTTALNFPMAFVWQIFYAGPFVRFIFSKIFTNKKTINE